MGTIKTKRAIDRGQFSFIKVPLCRISPLEIILTHLAAHSKNS